MKKILKHEIFHDGFIALLIFSVGFIFGLVYGSVLYNKKIETAEKQVVECIELNNKMLEFQEIYVGFNHKLLDIIHHRQCIED